MAHVFSPGNLILLLDWLPPGTPGHGLVRAALEGDLLAEALLCDCLEEHGMTGEEDTSGEPVQGR